MIEKPMYELTNSITYSALINSNKNITLNDIIWENIKCNREKVFIFVATTELKVSE